jgi:hypothetical protein
VGTIIFTRTSTEGGFFLPIGSPHLTGVYLFDQVLHLFVCLKKNQTMILVDINISHAIVPIIRSSL